MSWTTSASVVLLQRVLVQADVLGKHGCQSCKRLDLRGFKQHVPHQIKGSLGRLACSDRAPGIWGASWELLFRVLPCECS